ncbi:MAG: hypothetical protein Q7T82_10950 [Armatimonadota bacterium]|nr:hypothetical protein [Armatimonadota bacterium]
MKSSINGDEVLSPDYLRELRLERMPRFMWRATAECEGRVVLDLLFDATDINQGAFFIRAIEYDPALSFVLRVASKAQFVQNTPKTDPLWRVLQWFADQPVL